MRRTWPSLLILSMFAVAMTACFGGSGPPIPPPDGFERMTATVLGNDGAPLAGLAVRVEGRDAGTATDAAGVFTLESNAFPNGVEAENEISLGRNGIILGSRTVIPADNESLLIHFGVTNPTGSPGSLSGNIFDEATEAQLDGVEVTLFSVEGGVLQTRSSGGAYNFDEVPAGGWNLAAYLEGYHPEMASVFIEEGGEVVQHLALTPEGTIPKLDGIMVKGTVSDGKSGAPIAGVTISLFADTGYVGIPEPGIWEDINEWDSADGGLIEGLAPPPRVAASSDGEPSKEPASIMPWLYDPQYQETTTNADGTFEFPDEVAGYSIWLDFYAEGYLNGNHWEDINGRTGVLDLDLTLAPIIETDISGTVVDENGDPIAGAYVEFIFGGGFDVLPMGMAIPGATDWEEFASDGQQNRNDIGAPPPPPAPNSGGEGGWDDWADSDIELAGMGDPLSPDGSGGPNFDNQMMQRFRFEKQQEGKDSSSIYFDGYYAMTTAEDGVFSFEGVPAGSYYVFASAYRHISYSEDVEAAEDPALNIFDITLPSVPVGAVEGTVTDEDGNPVPDTLVNAIQPNVDPFTYTDESGYFFIDNIPTGVWIISAYKSGYLTRSKEQKIEEGLVHTVNLAISRYTPPPTDFVNYTGHLLNGTDSTPVAGADMVFTPLDPEYGGYFQHVYSGENGGFSAQLVPTEYNLLIQKEGFEDLFIRIWVDSLWPKMDLMLWPIGSGGGPWGGPVQGGVIGPMLMDMPEMPNDDF
ncbi:carboxypeptidase regulatory-like domain-containing protein [bacterium]|nr:carboxypeptidase regulatory-like domain-containing protein [bacterium]